MWTIEHERTNEIADAVLMSHSSNAQKYGECFLTAVSHQGKEEQAGRNMLRVERHRVSHSVEMKNGLMH